MRHRRTGTNVAPPRRYPTVAASQTRALRRHRLPMQTPLLGNHRSASRPSPTYLFELGVHRLPGKFLRMHPNRPLRRCRTFGTPDGIHRIAVTRMVKRRKRYTCCLELLNKYVAIRGDRSAVMLYTNSPATSREEIPRFRDDQPVHCKYSPTLIPPGGRSRTRPSARKGRCQPGIPAASVSQENP